MFFSVHEFWRKYLYKTKIKIKIKTKNKIKVKIKIKTKVKQKIIKLKIKTFIIFPNNGGPFEIIQSRMSYEIFLRQSQPDTPLIQDMHMTCDFLEAMKIDQDNFDNFFESSARNLYTQTK